MGIVRVDNMLVVQLQSADESRFQLIQKVQRTAQKSHMSANGFAAGQTGDSLVYHSLKDGGGQVFLGSAVIDQGLDVRFGKHAAACSNRVQRMIASGVFV